MSNNKVLNLIFEVTYDYSSIQSLKMITMLVMIYTYTRKKLLLLLFQLLLTPVAQREIFQGGAPRRPEGPSIRAKARRASARGMRSRKRGVPFSWVRKFLIFEPL